MKNKIYSKNTHWTKRALTYIVTFALLFQSVPASAFLKRVFSSLPYQTPDPTLTVAPAVITTNESYQVLSDGFIQDELNGSPLLEIAEGGKFEVPYYIDHNAPEASDIASFVNRLGAAPPKGQEPTLIPIAGEITFFVPGQRNITHFSNAGTATPFGTSAAQAVYVKEQVYQLLGRTLIDTNLSSYATEQAQLNTLYSNAYSFVTSRPDVFYGQKLNLNRFNSGLSYDMVWPEIRTINGKRVTVPVVYLSKATVDARKIDGNVTEVYGNITLEALTVDGVDIRLGREAFLSVANNLLNNQGSIVSDGDLQIVAGGALKNISGLIEAQGDLRIAAHSIENQTIIHRFNDRNANYQRQGTRYGEVAAINAVNGNLILRSYSDIIFRGAIASAGGELTLAADGNIYLGSERVQTSYTNGGSHTGSTVSYLQSSLTAEDTLKLIANGQIIIDAAEIVSDQGHIELLAGLGITIEDDLAMRQFARTFHRGSESLYKTTAMRALLDAGKGIRIHSEFGDITMRAADIRSSEGTSVKATNGGVNLLMTVENDHYRYNYTKKGFFTTKTINRGHDIETGVQNSIVGGFAVESLNGLVVEYEGNRDFTLDEQITELAKFEGMEWMADVRANTPNVDWQAIELKYEEWNITRRSLSPAFAAIISIAVAIAAGPGITELFTASGATSATVLGSTTLGAAAVGATTALVSQATLALANGAVNGDIGEALENLASSDTLKSLAIAAVTAGAIHAVNAEFFQVTGDQVNPDSFLVDTYVDSVTREVSYQLSLAGQATQALTHATVRAGVSNIIAGGNSDGFGDAFLQSLGQHTINTIGENITQRIGLAAKGDELLGIAPDIDTATQYIAHAAVGCLTGGLMSRFDDGETHLGCVSGAGGAIIGEYIGQRYEQDLESDLKEWINGQVSGGSLASQEQIIQQGLVFKQRGVDMARLSAALTAFAFGGDVNIAADAGQNVAENNALFTTIVIISALAYTTYVSYQEGGLYEGLQSIGRGDDPLSQKVASATEASVEFLVEEFPEAAEKTGIVLNAVGDVISAGVTVILETETGETVTRYWNEIPLEKRNALIGAGKVVSFVIPASVVSKLTKLRDMGPEIEVDDWIRDPNHPNWDSVAVEDKEFLNAHSVGAVEWGLIPSKTKVDGQEINIHLDYSRREHVLYGDSNAKGGHSTNSGDVVPRGEVEVADNGVRRAIVDINGVEKSNYGGKSTLFPESWTDADIMREFSEGLTNGSVRANGGYITTTPSGVRVQFYLSGDNVRSFYPVFE